MNSQSPLAKETIWKILAAPSWDFRKYLPEKEILIQGQVTVKPIQGKPKHQEWREQGSWCDAQHKVYTCMQIHQYVLEGDRLLIYFGPEAESLLHEFQLPPDARLPFTLQHTHHCGQDSYACDLTFLSSRAFQMIYTVTGPKKNYRIQALYTRRGKRSS